MLRRIALAGLAITCTGCAAWLDRVDSSRMAPRLEYRGFSFERPPNPSWYHLNSEQTQTRAVLRRDISDSHLTHSFYALVMLESLPSEPTSVEEFAKLAEPPPQEAPYRVREESRHTEPVTKQGQWCIRFETTDLELGAPVAPDQELVMTVRGFRCLHPAFPKTVLTLYYSERGTREELDPELSKEGETFLRGVRIDVAPGTPATAL